MAPSSFSSAVSSREGEMSVTYVVQSGLTIKRTGPSRGVRGLNVQARPRVISKPEGRLLPSYGREAKLGVTRFVGSARSLASA